METGYIVRFIRKDGMPDEEYFYHNYEDAANHLEMFRDDDSELYWEICIEATIDSKKESEVLTFLR